MTENKTVLAIEDLKAEYFNPSAPEKAIPILQGINLQINEGEIHAIMGPNGSGKSTLSSVIMGHPHYRITGGAINLKNRQTGILEDISQMPVHERARAGLFLSFQYPAAVAGLPVTQFLRSSLKALRDEELSVKVFRKELNETMQSLNMSPDFARRYLNDGFSGGEKKRMEILQMKMMQPRVAILDEIDSGLDIDALKLVSEGINSMTSESRSFLLITHYKRLLDYVTPQTIHVLVNGRIVESGGIELADRLESGGYDEIIQSVKKTA